MKTRRWIATCVVALLGVTAVTARRKVKVAQGCIVKRETVEGTICA